MGLEAKLRYLSRGLVTDGACVIGRMELILQKAGML